MYNFWCDHKLPIEQKLLFVKHLLPRYLNGIPDTEYLALYKCKEHLSTYYPIIVETGCGASSIVLAQLAWENSGLFYNWDTNELKQQEIKNVISNMENGSNILMRCVFIPAKATDEHLGIKSILVNHRIDMAFLDSEHTSDNLTLELDEILPLLSHKAIIAIDDADLNYVFRNTGLVNIQRRKLGLKPIDEQSQNIGLPFSQILISKLDFIPMKHWSLMADVMEYYRNNIVNDETNSYYAIDKQQMIASQLENENKNLTRFLPILIEGVKE